MLVSIVMPIYNAAPFIEACLDSILAQTYVDWELLAVDDGSTDKSWELLAAYEKKEPRIRGVKMPHGGIIPALQAGFQQARGILICRMDADDKMPVNKLILMQEACEANGLGCLITGKVTYFSEQALGEGYQQYAAWLNALIDQNNHRSQLFRECVIPSCAWMLHRADFLRCGGFQSEIYPEDYDLCFRFFQQELKIISLPEVLHHWRDHPARSSRNDPNYLDNRFLDLKLHYFLLLILAPANNLVLWGAGKKGKYIAQYLLKQPIDFEWMTNNPKKIGKEIYGKKIISTRGGIPSSGTNKYIIAVANREEQGEIDAQLIAEEMEEGKDFFFFA